MADDKKAASAASSQLWENLANVPDAIARRFGIDASMLDEFRHLLVSEVLTDNSVIEHRVRGRKHRYDKSRPLKEQLRFVRSAPEYWTSMDFDPATGTVARPQGPDLRDRLDDLLASESGVPQPAAGGVGDATGQPERIPVEVYMPSVDKWFEQTGRERLRARHSATAARDVQEPPAQIAEAAQAPLGRKMKYTSHALSAWYVLRLHGWPAGEPGPSEEEDLRDARNYFDRVPRDAIRKVRDAKAPDAWKTPGPRNRR
jgi:hypothetical protein